MKINPALTGAMSGSAGGITASRNKGGQYLRRRSVPVNSRTPQQQAARTNFGTAVQLWTEATTAAQREAWNVFAAATPTLDSLGNTIQLTGQQRFVAANSLALLAGLNPILDAPTIFNTGFAPSSIAHVQVEGTDMEILVNFDAALEAAGTLFAFLARPQNASRARVPSTFRFVGIADLAAAATTGAVNTPVADIPYPLAFPGGAAWIRAVMLYDDGRVSQDLIAEVATTNAP